MASESIIRVFVTEGASGQTGATAAAAPSAGQSAQPTSAAAATPPPQAQPSAAQQSAAPPPAAAEDGARPGRAAEAAEGAEDSSWAGFAGRIGGDMLRGMAARVLGSMGVPLFAAWRGSGEVLKSEQAGSVLVKAAEKFAVIFGESGKRFSDALLKQLGHDTATGMATVTLPQPPRAAAASSTMPPASAGGTGPATTPGVLPSAGYSPPDRAAQTMLAPTAGQGRAAQTMLAPTAGQGRAAQTMLAPPGTLPPPPPPASVSIPPAGGGAAPGGAAAAAGGGSLLAVTGAAAAAAAGLYVIGKAGEIASTGIRMAGEAAAKIVDNDVFGMLRGSAQAAIRTLDQIPLLGPALTALPKVFLAVGEAASVLSQAFLKRAQELSGVSPPIAAAQAQADVRRVLMDIREGQVLGISMGRLIDANVRLEEALRDLLLPFKAGLLSATTEVVQEAGTFFKVISKWLAEETRADAADDWIRRFLTVLNSFLNPAQFVREMVKLAVDYWRDAQAVRDAEGDAMMDMAKFLDGLMRQRPNPDLIPRNQLPANAGPVGPVLF